MSVVIEYGVFKQKNFKNISMLYTNALYYQGIGEIEGALISYSSCASIIETILITQTPRRPIGVPPSPVMQSAPASALVASSDDDLFGQDVTTTPMTIIEDLSTCLEEDTQATATECINNLQVLQQRVLGQIETLQVKLQQKKASSNSNDSEEKKTKDWESMCIDVSRVVFEKGSSNCIFFSDLAGLKKEKELIRESLVNPLIYPNLYPKVGKGFLLYGPPGTGKTFIAKAAVNQLQIEDPNVKVLFFAPTGADFKGKYVGETEQKITKWFDCASKAACECEAASNSKTKFISVLFIDEIDSIARDRSKDTTGLGSNSVNTLLQMMDGMESYDNVAVIGATNYPWELDAAVLRRFDTQILLDLPDRNAAEQSMNIEFTKFIKLKEKSIGACKTWRGRGVGVSEVDIVTETHDDKKTNSCDSKCEPHDSKNEALWTLSPYNLFDFNYIKAMEKLVLKAIAGELVNKENHFSYSDISKVMSRAANLTATSALNNNVFYNPGKIFAKERVLDTEVLKYFSKFWLSTLTTMKEEHTIHRIGASYYDELQTLLNMGKLGDIAIDNTTTFTQDNKRLKDFFEKFYIHKPPKTLMIIKEGIKYVNTKILFNLDASISIKDIGIDEKFINFDLDLVAYYYDNKKMTEAAKTKFWTEFTKRVPVLYWKLTIISTINSLNMPWEKKKEQLNNMLNTVNKFLGDPGVPAIALRTEEEVDMQRAAWGSIIWPAGASAPRKLGYYDNWARKVDLIVKYKQPIKWKNDKNTESKNNIFDIAIGVAEDLVKKFILKYTYWVKTLQTDLLMVLNALTKDKHDNRWAEKLVSLGDFIVWDDLVTEPTPLPREGEGDWDDGDPPLKFEEEEDGDHERLMECIVYIWGKSEGSLPPPPVPRLADTVVPPAVQNSKKRILVILKMFSGEDQDFELLCEILKTKEPLNLYSTYAKSVAIKQVYWNMVTKKFDSSSASADASLRVNRLIGISRAAQAPARSDGDDEVGARRLVRRQSVSEDALKETPTDNMPTVQNLENTFLNLLLTVFNRHSVNIGLEELPGIAYVFQKKKRELIADTIIYITQLTRFAKGNVSYDDTHGVTVDQSPIHSMIGYMKLVSIFKSLNAVCGHTENGDALEQINSLNSLIGENAKPEPDAVSGNSSWRFGLRNLASGVRAHFSSDTAREGEKGRVTKLLNGLEKLYSDPGALGDALSEYERQLSAKNLKVKFTDVTSQSPPFYEMYKTHLVTHKLISGDLVSSFEALIHFEIDFEDDNFKHVNRAAGIKDFWQNITQLTGDDDDDTLQSSIRDLVTKLEALDTTFLSYAALLSKGVGIQTDKGIIHWRAEVWSATDKALLVIRKGLDLLEMVVTFIVTIWIGGKAHFKAFQGGEDGYVKFISHFILGLLMYGGAMWGNIAGFAAGFAGFAAAAPIVIAILLMLTLSFKFKAIEESLDFIVGIGIYFGIAIVLPDVLTIVAVASLAILIARKIINSVLNWAYPAGHFAITGTSFKSNLAKNFTRIGPTDIEFENKSIEEENVNKKLLKLYINKFKGAIVLRNADEAEKNYYEGRYITAIDGEEHNIFKFSATYPEGQRIILNIKQSIKVIDILPAKIAQAIVEQPTSYDPNLGLKLQNYDKNRMKFLQDMRAEEKKKSS